MSVESSVVECAECGDDDPCEVRMLVGKKYLCMSCKDTYVSDAENDCDGDDT